MNRLLFISRLFPNPAVPTYAPFAQQLLNGFQRIGVKVRVISPLSWFGRTRLPGGRFVSVPGSGEVCGIPARYPRFLCPPRILGTKHHLFYRACIARVLDCEVRNLSPDHVMVSFAYPDAAAMGAACERRGLNYSVQVLGSDFLIKGKQSGVAAPIRQTLLRAPLVTCPGERLADSLREAGVLQNRVVSFRNGVDAALFFPRPSDALPSEKRTVLFVGSLREVKGVDRLIEAWRLLMSQNNPPAAELHLVGDGELEAGLRETTRAAGLEASVKFRGRQPREQVAEAMRAAHCLVLPSRSEGMPNVVLEALASGVPVVGSDAGEMPRLISDGENGFVVPQANAQVAEFATALAEALGKVLARDWDGRAISAPLAEYTWDNAARTLRAAIEGE